MAATVEFLFESHVFGPYPTPWKHPAGTEAWHWNYFRDGAILPIPTKSGTFADLPEVSTGLDLLRAFSRANPGLCVLGLRAKATTLGTLWLDTYLTEDDIRKL